METIHSISELRKTLTALRRTGKRIGFVPTMGNLHAGHITLVTEARKVADIVVSSIFVNPTQFGPNEDFDQYPRTLETDQAKLDAAGCDIVFAPPTDEIYPGNQDTWAKVVINDITRRHCGTAREGHFDGVSTVVAKLFNIVQPDTALFGKKDFQQLAVIKRMVTALCFDIDIIGVDTVREENGLAMSSRNGYLTKVEKTIAATLYQTLQETKNAIRQGNTDFASLGTLAQKELTAAGFKPEYFNVCRTDDLGPATETDHDLVILAAAQLGKARLIDNIDFKWD